MMSIPSPKRFQLPTETQWLEDDFAPFFDPNAYLGELFAVSFRVKLSHLSPARMGSPEKTKPPIFRCYAAISAMLGSGRSNDF